MEERLKFHQNRRRNENDAMGARADPEVPIRWVLTEGLGGGGLKYPPEKWDLGINPQEIKKKNGVIYAIFRRLLMA